MEEIFVGLAVVEGAAYGGIDACQQLFHAEGLGDVVVGTDFEAFEFVGL